MADQTTQKEQNTQDTRTMQSDIEMDIETLLRQSVLLPSQKSMFDRYMTESTNEQQKQEFRDVLEEIEREVLQTYEEYRYTGKPVADFLKWKDEEIAPLSKILTKRVKSLFAKEFGEDEPEVGEAGRDLPSESTQEEFDQAKAEKDKKAAEEQEEEIKKEQEMTANGYTREENEQWQKFLDRRAEKQKEWDQFLKNRREAEKQAEKDEELFRDHPEYFSDPYQESIDTAEKEAARAQEEYSNRQYLDANARAEEARYLHSFSNHHTSDMPDDGSGVPGVEVTHKDSSESSYVGEMLQGMLDGRLDWGTPSSGGAPAPVSDNSTDYEARVNKQIESRMAQLRAAQKARKQYSVPRTADQKGVSSAGSEYRPVIVAEQHNNGSVSSHLSSSPGGVSESGASGAGTGTASGAGAPVDAGVSASGGPRFDEIRSLKHDKTGIRTQKLTDKEAAKQYAANISEAYKNGASVLRHEGSSLTDSLKGRHVPYSGKSDKLSSSANFRYASTTTGTSASGQSVGGYGAPIQTLSVSLAPNSGLSGETSGSLWSSEHTDNASAIRDRIIYGSFENAKKYSQAARSASSAFRSSDSYVFTERQKTSNTSSGSPVEDSTSQVRDGSARRSILRYTRSGFVKNSSSGSRGESGSSIFSKNMSGSASGIGSAVSGAIGAGGVTEGASIVGANGVLTAGTGTVVQIGKMAAKGAAYGMNKAKQAFYEGTNGGSSSQSSSENKEMKKMESAARIMREKIIGAAGAPVGASAGIKTAANISFRVVQKFSNDIREAQGDDDSKEGTSDDPETIKRIWLRRVRMNTAEKKKSKLIWVKGGAGIGGADLLRRIVKGVGGLATLAKPILIIIIVLVIFIFVSSCGTMLMHQVNASLPASGRYDMSGEEIGDYLSSTSDEDDGDDDSTIATPENTTDTWTGAKLTKEAGRITGPSGGEETYYNLDMQGVVDIMRSMGNNDEYWVRDDGVKMLGDYVMVAANFSVHPRGSKVETSLGTGIVCDTGGFAASHPQNLDIAVDW